MVDIATARPTFDDLTSVASGLLRGQLVRNDYNVEHMLSRGEDYAFARPSLVREKLRRLQLMTGAERRKGKRNPVRVFATREQHQLDKQLAAQAELAYRRLMVDWQPSRKQGAGAAAGRASRGPSNGQAARQETAPPPAL